MIRNSLEFGDKVLSWSEKFIFESKMFLVESGLWITIREGAVVCFIFVDYPHSAQVIIGGDFVK